jgi:hypothetical protein
VTCFTSWTSQANIAPFKVVDIGVKTLRGLAGVNLWRINIEFVHGIVELAVGYFYLSCTQ